MHCLYYSTNGKTFYIENMFQGDVSCLPMAWGLPFFAPMAVTPSSFVYVNDFVMFQAGNESMQGCVKSFLLQGVILCVVWLCSPLPTNKFTQESVSGVYAKIQCVYPVGFDTCSVGDTIEVPVTDIQKVICAPAILKWKIPGSTALTSMTQEVRAFMWRKFCLSVCNIFL